MPELVANHLDRPRLAPRQPWRVIALCLLTLLPALIQWQPVGAQTPEPATNFPHPSQVRLPYITGGNASVEACPTTSSKTYDTMRVNRRRTTPRVPVFDPDLNLTMRGYAVTTAPLHLIGFNGDTDGDPPQLAYLFRPSRVPTFDAAYRVHDWDWSVQPDGRRGDPITTYDVTLIQMATASAETLYPPDRRAYVGGDFIALVLYAEEFRLTLAYLEDDTVADGYVVHIDNFCVDPNLLALYHQMNATGRVELPALRRTDSIGNTLGESVFVAVRDRGSFMDPRSAKDWWQATARAYQAAQATQPATPTVEATTTTTSIP